MSEYASGNQTKHMDFILLDCLSLEIALYLACLIRHTSMNPFLNPLYRNLFLVYLFINLIVILIFDVFNGILKRGYYKELIQVLFQACIDAFFIAMYAFVTQQGAEYSRIIIGVSMLLYILLTYVVRIFRKWYLRKNMNKLNGNALLIVSDRSEVQALIKEVRENNYAGYQIVGIALPRQLKREDSIDRVPIVTDYSGIVEYVKNHWVDEVLISIGSGRQLSDNLIDTLTMMGVTVHVNFSQIFNSYYAKQSIESIGGLRVLSVKKNYMTPLQHFLKRMIDVSGGFAGCICTGFLYLFLAPAIKRESPGPVFYSQIRIGQNGKPFRFYKFRSMYPNAEEQKKELMNQNRFQGDLMFKMEFDPRVIGNHIDQNGNKVTGVGEFIRKYSIDEFPQFWNVLKGDMSLVGTRPPLQEEYEKYSAHQKARLAVKPGITGLWQISGRSDILDFDQVVKYDTEYINNWSIGLDLKILLKTIKVVAEKKGSM